MASMTDNTTQHTPGPWAWHEGHDTIWPRGRDGTGPEVVGPSESGLYGPEYQPVVQGFWRNDGVADAEASSPANARLIAAAPDLLAACKAALKGLNGGDWPALCAAAVVKAEGGAA